MESTPDDAGPLRFGAFVLDRANARLLRDGKPVDLAPKDFDVLSFLVGHPGRLITKDELLDAVWKHRFVSESVLKSVVSRLRGVLGDSVRDPGYIETAPRRGYRFVARVDAPLPAARVDVSPPTAATPGHPTTGNPTAGTSLVGRAEPLARLHAQLAGVAAGRARVLLLAGEAGMGKSRLIEHFMHEAAATAVVALGQCVEHTGDVEPYLPVLDALSGMCRSRPDAGWVALMRQVAPMWLVQLPWFVTPADRLLLQQELGGATQERMLREFGELLDRITEPQPLVLVLEDLHWCDPASLRLVDYLARRRGTARVLLLGSLRPAELAATGHPLHTLRQELVQHGACEEIDLVPFSERDTLDYLARRPAPSRWSEPLVRALHRHTGGLPLFLAAVVDELGEADAGAARDTLPLLREVPRSIFGLIARQCARLPDRTQRWLEAASVAGVEFLHLPLAAALQTDPDQLQSTFDGLVRGGTWLRSVGAAALPDGRVSARYAFTHAVHRDVLYELAGAAGRLRMHRAIAAALLQVNDGRTEQVAAEVALHCEKGEDPSAAVRHLAIAAEQALRRFAAVEAAQIAQRALALLATLDDRGALRDTEVALQVAMGVAQAELKGITSKESRHAFGRTVGLMKGLHATRARVPALHGIWWATLAKGEMAEARQMAEQTLALAQDRGDELLRFASHSALGMTLVHIGDMPQAQQHLQHALALHRDTDSQLPQAMFSVEPGVQLACYLAQSLWSQGQPSAAMQRLRAATARAEGLRHPITQVLALQFEAMLHTMASEFGPVRDTTQRALDIVARHALERASGPHRWMQGSAMAALGEVDAGLERMREGRALQQRHGLEYGLTRWHQAYAQACLQAGRHLPASEAVQEGLAMAQRTGELGVVAELYQLQGNIDATASRDSAAAAAFAQACEMAQHQGALHTEIAAAADWCRLGGARKKPARAALAAALARWSDPLEPPAISQARRQLARR